MKPISWLGILLIVLGALALVYQGINYTRQKQVVDVGGLPFISRRKPTSIFPSLR